MSYKLLIINPGSTSTKIGVYEDEREILEETLRHSSDEIGKYPTIVDQLDFRKDVILKVLEEKNFDIKTLNAVVGRGGMLKPIPGGTYEVTDALVADLKKGVQGQHASNLGGILAKEIGNELNVPSFIVDGDGPFSPERAGGVPVGDLVKMCFSGKYSEKEVYSKLVGKGGCVAYLNTNDFRDVLKLSEEGNKEAQLIYDAFIYQVAKEIGAMATVLEGNVDKIILTGGMAYSEKVVGDITKRVGWISEVKTYPGEDELLALAQGAIRVLDGEEKAKEY